MKVQADDYMAGAVDIASHETVAFYLASFKAIGEEPQEPLQLEEELDTCLQREIRRARPAVNFIRAKSIRSAFPAAAVPSSPMDPQVFLSMYKEASAVIERPAYLVLLDAEARVGEPKWNVVSGLGVVAGREREVVLYLIATIVDVPREKVIGDIKAAAHGRRGGAFGMLLFIIPFGGTSDVRFEEELCVDLGRALSERINTR